MIFLTAGESHGKCLIGIIDGYPSGVKVDLKYINEELSRRQRGYGRGGRMSIEKDKAELLSGIRKGFTTGSPISFSISNKDWKNWKDVMDVFPDDNKSQVKEKPVLNPRPGHADLTGFLKYGLSDIRDVIERSSARETAARVCIGALAKLALKTLDIEVYSYVIQIGKVFLNKETDLNKKIIYSTENSDLRCPDADISDLMREEILKAKEKGDTLGGRFRIIATGVPPGLGSYTQWDRRIDGVISKAVMSIPAIKEVDIGNGLAGSKKMGTEVHDEIFFEKKSGFYRKTNNAGGMEGGMTNGENIIVTASMKPIPTTAKGLGSIDIGTGEKSISLKERSDVCAVPAASIVGESVIAIELLNLIQNKFGSDSMADIKRNLTCYLRNIRKL